MADQKVMKTEKILKRSIQNNTKQLTKDFIKEHIVDQRVIIEML